MNWTEQLLEPVCERQRWKYLRCEPFAIVPYLDDGRFKYQLRRDDSGDPRGYVVLGYYLSAAAAKASAERHAREVAA